MSRRKRYAPETRIAHTLNGNSSEYAQDCEDDESEEISKDYKPDQEGDARDRHGCAAMGCLRSRRSGQSLENPNRAIMSLL